ncbi:MAG: hypothetical protein WCG25_06385 [bacterium]
MSVGNLINEDFSCQIIIAISRLFSASFVKSKFTLIVLVGLPTMEISDTHLTDLISSSNGLTLGYKVSSGFLLAIEKTYIGVSLISTFFTVGYFTSLGSVAYIWSIADLISFTASLLFFCVINSKVITAKL